MVGFRAMARPPNRAERRRLERERSPKKPPSPSDQLGVALFCLAAVVSVIFYLAEKSRWSVGLSVVAINVFMGYPIVHFLRRIWTRTAVFLCIIALSAVLGYMSWPKPVPPTVAELKQGLTSPAFKRVLIDRFPLGWHMFTIDNMHVTDPERWFPSGNQKTLFVDWSSSGNVSFEGKRMIVDLPAIVARRNNHHRKCCFFSDVRQCQHSDKHKPQREQIIPG